MEKSKEIVPQSSKRNTRDSSKNQFKIADDQSETSERVAKGKAEANKVACRG